MNRHLAYSYKKNLPSLLFVAFTCRIISTYSHTFFENIFKTRACFLKIVETQTVRYFHWVIYVVVQLCDTPFLSENI